MLTSNLRATAAPRHGFTRLIRIVVPFKIGWIAACVGCGRRVKAYQGAVIYCATVNGFPVSYLCARCGAEDR